MRTRRTSRLALAALAGVLHACSGGGESRAAAVSYIDESVAELETLGWLGARTHPLTRPLSVEREGSPHSPGGVVLRELAPEGALARAGARVGDVLVRVGEDWLPLAEDPTLDLIRLVEQEVSAGKTSIALSAWRDGALSELSIASDQPALEVGLPVEVERFRRAGRAAADWLAAQQRAEGGFEAPTGASELALDALAALALRSVGSGSDDAAETSSPALERCEARVDALLADPATDADAPGLALALALWAERIGPLSAEIVLRAAPRAVAISGNMPAGGEGGAPKMVFFGSAPTGGVSELHPPEGAEIEMITIGGDGGELPGGITLPEGFELPEGAEIQIQGLPEGMELGAFEAALPAAESPAVDFGALIAELDPERKAALEKLGALAKRLLATQAEDGSFGAAPVAEASRLLPTALALWSLGSAQRVGLELEAEPIERGCKLLRELAHEGKVAAAVARGADRRNEAGRAAAAANAFLALGCPDTDPLVQALLQYSDEAGRHVLGASSAISFHVLSTAALRRGRELGDWARFYDEFRIALVAWQEPDGSFRIPADRGEADAPWASGPLFDTAIGAIVLGMQSEPLPVLLRRAENPFAPAIDGEGKRSGEAAPDAAEALENMPEGAVQITDPAKIQELLDSMGVEGDVQIMSGGDAKEDGR